MTFTEEYNTDQEQDFAESSYPQAFGITFTPQVTGIALGGLGVLGSLYLFMNMVMPVYNTYQEQKTQENNLIQEVERQKSGEYAKKIQEVEAQLQQKRGMKEQVLAFFGNEKSINTLLLDMSRFFKSRNIYLVSFTPQNPVQGQPTPGQTAIDIINDNSLGAAVNNKLKRQTIAVEMEGSFEATQAILRDLERLQPLILIKGLNSQLTDDAKKVKVITTNNQAQIVPTSNQDVKTNFLLQVILPLTPEELAQFAPPPPPEQQQPPPAQ